MAQPQLETATSACGLGWTARIWPYHIYVTVYPEGDFLRDAVRTLVSPTQQPWWDVEWSHDEADGREVWLLQRTV